MAFKIFQYPEANEDILEAVNYYKNISYSVASNFERQLSKAYDKLEKNPFFQIRYDDVRALPLKNFLISFYFMLMKLKWLYM